MWTTWKPYLICAIGAGFALLALLWPALYNGQPFIFADTSSYIRSADAGINKITKHETAWSAAASSSNQPKACAGTGERLSSVTEKIVLEGRSVYYGVFLYVSDLFGGFWAAALLQALIVLLAIGMTVREIAGDDRRFLTGLCVGLSLITPLAFFASFMMPDIFTGIAILALANVLIFGNAMPRWRLAVWGSLLVMALLFHVSNTLIVVISLFGALLYLLISRHAPGWRGIGIVAFALAIGFLGNAAFDLGVRKSLGAPPIRPPHITARLLADGPGAEYLKAKCPGAGFAACRYLGVLPVRNPDDFLWSTNPKHGAFMLADAATKRALGDEQYRFLFAVLAYAPIRQSAASLENVTQQLGMSGLSEFNVDAADTFFECHLPGTTFADLKNTKFWQGTMPVTVVEYLTLLSAVVSLGIIFWSLARSYQHKLPFSRADTFAAAVLFGLAINAAVCGALSTPHDRYEARAIWLLPLAAALVVKTRRRALPAP